MRIIDLHCYPGTHEWIACQGPYVEALAKYWNRQWVGKTEDEALKDFTAAGVEACLVALDLETTIATPPVTNEYVHAMWKRHPKRIIQAWGAVEPAKGEIAIRQVRIAVRELGVTEAPIALTNTLNVGLVLDVLVQDAMLETATFG